MISDLLDVTRLEEGKMPLHAAKGDLCLTLREVVADVGPLAAHHDFQFQCEPQECMAVYDESILRRVVKNLVGNALKFTPSGRLVRLELESAGDQVRVTVRDSGPGIPEASQPRVFDKFWQAQGRQEGQKHSTGLGLTFCKLAVEAMGGRITVASREGEGSAFSFTLPL
jgi:signal transduction histidine kinase